MALKSFANTTFGELPIGAGFVDPHLGAQKTIRGAPGGVGDFSIFYSRHGLFVKIQAEIMLTNPAGTPRDHIYRTFRGRCKTQLDGALDKLMAKPRLQSKSVLARMDGPLVRLTLGGVRKALSMGITYDPSRKLASERH